MAEIQPSIDHSENAVGVARYENDENSTMSIYLSSNGVGATLHYPIVTEPSSKRKLSLKQSSSLKDSSNLKESISSTLKRKTKQFLGLDEDEQGEREFLWTERRIRLANRKYGGIDIDKINKTLPRPPLSMDSPDGELIHQASVYTTYPRHKQSVANFMVDGISTLGRKIRGESDDVKTQLKSRSFIPKDIYGDSSSTVPIDQEIFFDKVPRVPEPTFSRNSERNITRLSDKNRIRPLGKDKSSLKTFNQSQGSDTVDKREYGIGVVGEAFGRDYLTMVRSKPHVKKQLDDMDDYRPYFTYWVTTVQVIIMIVSLVLYGFGPIGVELNQSRGQVLSHGLFIEEVDYLEPSNFWLGPRPADLIHLGAKFSPCMRKDDLLLEERRLLLERERETGCCVRNDYSGCSQTSREECSSLVSTFHKWSTEMPGPDGRISGPVCGQDPQYCTAPLSSYSNTWPDDISSWPICYVSSLPKTTSFWGIGSQKLSPAPVYMTCERISRPCCFGIHGKCEIRTQEFCDFVHGYFHAEANLCSQVSCMQDVCGMLPFFNSNYPDQIYRLWTGLFLHAGIIHLLITLLVQLYLMRDMEKLCGSFRMGIIYLGSGMAGNIASAIFIPFRAESGPAGAQFGVLASLIVEVLNVWPALKSPGVALGKLISIISILFLMGLLPWVDNYAHIVGFFTGFLLSYSLMPYVAFEHNSHNKTKRAALITVCLIMFILIFVTLTVIFYNIPNTECEWCKYLTCIPLTKGFCADQNINFMQDPPILNF